MSLTDAFLLDPAPFNVWIAYRGDGAGSGTASDPYDGAPALSAVINITNLSNVTSDPTEAIVTANNSLANGDVVIVSGATGNDADKWNGTFSIYGVTTTGFKYRMSAAPEVVQSVTGTKIARKVISCPLDAILDGLPSNARVHLGPTGSGNPFLTEGYRVDASDPLTGAGWQLRPGMKVLGSGMDVTQLRLIHASQNASYFAMAHALKQGAGTSGDPFRPNPKDQVEVADLTIDCNSDATGVAGACGAVRIMGSHCRIHRVKVINWGTKSNDHPCHALSIIAAMGYADTNTNSLLETVNSGIADCIAIQPSHNSKREAVALHLGGVEASNGVQGYGKSPFIRNNYVDGASANGRVLSVVSGSGTRSSGTAIFTCRNGRVHNYTASQYVAVNRPGDPASTWNGYFNVTPDPNYPTTKFSFSLAGSGDESLITCGAEIRGISMANCRGGVVEGNQIHNVWLGGPYADVLNTKEIIIRNNTYKNVITAPCWKAGQLGNSSGDVVASAEVVEINGVPVTVTTITTGFPHNLYAKAWIKVTAQTDGGFFQLWKIVDLYKFEYIGSLPTGPSISFQLVQGVDKVVVEGNVIELADLDGTEYAAPNLADSPDYLPIAILLSDGAVPNPAPPFVFGDVVLRNNKIRYIDGRTHNAPTGQPMAGTGIQVARAQNLLVQNNVVEIIPASPLQNLSCGAVKYFNNQTPVGVIVQGYEAALGFKYSELATEAEDAFILAYLER